ncbi:sensor histidine kinase [Actinobacteria bacterium YIM 96077]|uniref:Oxygen sensor histidine kinase NreB n=1 Tax=Phytoactinopolyspora halophila TaxID=1981511 RepID=A0A329QQX0_9ACTN|nr:sensor histidine kinase [Phytoactinopolyspora halophila]AYY14233.1 sensor histidine kinase [Actinobacteria bacterium YIM 96077]RAW14775.1 hypothetical protein DPM12_09775 [Phytoactinopolyspora halophila]
MTVPGGTQPSTAAAPARRRSFIASAADMLARRSATDEAASPAAFGSLAAYERWWDRILPLWHTLYLGLLSLAIITTALDGRLDLEQRWTILSLLTVMAAIYLALGRSLFERPGGVRAAIYLSITWLSFYAIILVGDRNTSAFFILFALFPQVWAFLAPKIAGATSVAVILGMAGVNIHAIGWTWGTVARVVPQAVMQTGLVLLLGLLMVSVVNQAERRATLIDELEETRSELAETEHARGVLAERERLAHEIHDTLAQGFTSILTLSQAIDASLERDPARAREQLALIEQTARDNLAETRALIDALAPADLQDATLTQALSRVADRFSYQTGIGVELSMEGEQVQSSMLADIVLLRSVQEALTNVRKHADARRVDIALSHVPGDDRPERDVPDGDDPNVDGMVSVRITDDGRGFVPAESSNGEGFGLRGMRARVQQAGGELDVLSSPGRGTTIGVHLPIAARPSG